MARVLEGGTATPAVPGDLVGCSTPIFVLDPTRAAPATVSDGPAVPSRDDSILRILRALGGAPGTGSRAPSPRLDPIFVFTRLDALPEGLSSKLPRGNLLDEDHLTDARDQIGRTLMDAVAPRSGAFCRARSPSAGSPAVFLSYARADSGSGRLLTRTLPDHRQEPVYPFTQFRGLVDHLGALASQLS